MTASEGGSRPAPTALVTGASGGLGSVVAGFLAGEGYALLLVARHREALEESAARLRPISREVRVLVGDISEPSRISEIAREVSVWGRLDILVNNASELGPSPLSRLADYPLGELERVFRVNVLSPLALLQALRPYLAAAGGLVVNVSSDAAVGGYPGWGGYGASKAALDLMTRTLARELVEEKIAAVSVDPGDMRTAMHQAAYPGEDISDRPAPEVTRPFWAWLLGQERARISGGRFRAQAESWELPA